MKKKPTRGGAREGAGRKKGSGEGRKTVNRTVSLSPEADAKLLAKSEATGKSASKLVDDWARKLRIK